MLKVLVLCVLILCIAFVVRAQVTAEQPEFDATLQKLLSFSVQTMDVDTLAAQSNCYLVLDTRAKEEYDVSHIPGSIFLPNSQAIDTLADSFDTPIVLYCSVGYRSEKVGEKLLRMGYTNVYNLYGSIFEWANRSYELHDSKHQATDSLHVYSKRWSKWVDRPDLIKVW